MQNILLDPRPSNRSGKTGKLILASDACERGSYLHTVAGQVSQMAFDDLDAYHQQIKPMSGYTPVTDRSARAILEVNRNRV